jgi:hypothetical protein
MGDAIRRLDDTVEPALRRFGQEAAFVEGAEGRAWRVRGRGGVRLATRAPSCLVEPRSGDKVLIALSEDGEEAYLLAILSRTDGDASTGIAVEGDLHIDSREGKVEIGARSGIRMVTPGDIETAAHGMMVRVDDAKLFVKTMAYMGRELVSQVKVAKVAGARLDGAWESIRQHAKRVYRTATEGEYVRAQNVDVRCDNQLTLHGENAAITATQLVKMDAGQIVMG